MYLLLFLRLSNPVASPHPQLHSSSPSSWLTLASVEPPPACTPQSAPPFLMQLPTHGCCVPLSAQPHVVNVFFLGKGLESREMLQATQADIGADTYLGTLHIYIPPKVLYHLQTSMQFQSMLHFTKHSLFCKAFQIAV